MLTISILLLENSIEFTIIIIIIIITIIIIVIIIVIIIIIRHVERIGNCERIKSTLLQATCLVFYLILYIQLVIQLFFYLFLVFDSPVSGFMVKTRTL